MSDLFEEILTCTKCPDIDVITDENQQEVESHLDAEHMRGNNRISTTAFIIAHRPEDQERIQGLYEEAKPFLDSDFASDFLYHFDQRCWELAVYKYLTENSIIIYPPQRSAGPDFDTSLGYVECIAVTRGAGNDKVPYPKAARLHEDGTMDKIEFQPVPTNAIKLRISQAIHDKILKYQSYCKKDWFDKKKPRIIAINWFADGSVWASDHRDISINASLQALFGTGFQQIRIDTTTNEVVEEGLSSEPVLFKSNDAPVEVGYFSKPAEIDDTRIDGVLLSSKWPGFYDPKEFRAVSNPFASGIDLNALTIGLRTYTELDNKGIKIETISR